MIIQAKITQWKQTVSHWLSRTKKVLTDRRGEGTFEGVLEVFNVYSQVLIGKRIFEVERHFVGNQDVKEAIYTTVINENIRQKLIPDTIKQ